MKAPLLLSLALAVTLPAQTPAPTPVAALPSPATKTTEPDAGFVSIFDGRTLTNWDGDPAYWRVEDSALVGEITPENVIRRNTFIIWRGGSPTDFELKLEYRISDQGNSGVNYRGVELPDAKWSLAGYQADIDGPKRNKPGVRYTGQNYEERGRTFLAYPGQVVRADPDHKLAILGSTGDTKTLFAPIKEGDWNELHIIARGGVLTHLLNGQTMSVVIDDDTKARAIKGLIGMQVHSGPPMKVEFRNIRLKQL
jgi:Domain of Unknown Function (DUF1080)